MKWEKYLYILITGSTFISSDKDIKEVEYRSIYRSPLCHCG